MGSTPLSSRSRNSSKLLELENINLKVCLSGGGCGDCICTEFLLAIFPLQKIQILLYAVFCNFILPYFDVKVFGL